MIVRHFCSAAKRGKVIFSGIQPTGVMHIGNYFGAVSKWLEYQEMEDSNLMISVVDLHAMTTSLKPKEDMRRVIAEMTASLLAAGIKPEKCVLFQQSRVPHHCQMAWICACMSTLPQLNRLAQYKEKSEEYKSRGNIPVGLLTYPLLQAADILLYRAERVPVGQDQDQHMDIAAKIARTFNFFYGVDYFPVPQRVTGAHARVKSLRNPSKKMSKSDPDGKSRISLSDSSEQMRRSVKRALTDFTSEVTYDPAMRPGVANLIDLFSAITGKTPSQIVEMARGQDTGQFKDLLADVVIEKFGPIRDYTQIR